MQPDEPLTRSGPDLVRVISRDGTGDAVPTQSYAVRFSPRRRYPAVVVYLDLRVEVVAPPGTPRTALDDLYRRKSPWVERTLERFRAEARPSIERVYVPGERFLLAGRELVLEVKDGNDCAARVDGGVLRVRAPPGAGADEVRERVVEFYRRTAIDVIGPLLEARAGAMDVPPPPFRVKLLQRRWGSCSRAGRLNFNIRLAMAPPDELEYIVVHELCHLVHLDHSPAYWRTVERYMPDYGARRAALRAGSWLYVL
jgi:predicted metal-dependent hydrolase